MKSQLKRHFSLLLAVLLVLTMIPVSTIKVSAKAATATTAAKQTAKKADKKTTKKKMKKKTLALVLAFTMTAALFTGCGSKKETETTQPQTETTGHQQRGISSTERLAPGSSRRKAKLTSGTAGVRTHIPEYKTNLAIAKATKKELKKRGYKVIMLRTTNNCPLSNQQRTKKANKSGADIHICIHCNASGASAQGPLVCVPGSSRYVGKKIFNSSRKLGSCLLSSVAKAVNKRSHGTIRSDYYTTINWAKIPTMILECGFLTNSTEDRQLNSVSYQKKLAKGIADGVDKYFK